MQVLHRRAFEAAARCAHPPSRAGHFFSAHTACEILLLVCLPACLPPLCCAPAEVPLQRLDYPGFC